MTNGLWILAIWVICIAVTCLFKQLHIILVKIETGHYDPVYDIFCPIGILIIAVPLGPLLVSYWMYVIFKLFAMLYIKRFGNNTFCISDYVEAHLRRWMKHD